MPKMVVLLDCFWCPHPELNWDLKFRKLRLYPFELWGHAVLTFYKLAQRVGIEPT